MRIASFGSFLFKRVLPVVTAWLLAGGVVWSAPVDRRVILLSTESLTPDTAPWIGPTVRKDLLAELSNVEYLTAIAVDTVVPSGNDVLTTAREHQGDLVLVLDNQMIGSQLRLTARLLDVRNGQALGATQATGAVRDLFALEDELAAGVKDLINPPMPTTRPAASTPAAIPPTGPVRTGDYGPYGVYGMFNGSSLQRAIQTGNLGVGAPPAGENGAENRYYYGVPTSPWYPYYPGWYGYGYWYYPSVRWSYPIVSPAPAPTPFKPYRALPPSNVQGYFPMTLRPGR